MCFYLCVCFVEVLIHRSIRTGCNWSLVAIMKPSKVVSFQSVLRVQKFRVCFHNLGAQRWTLVFFVGGSI